MLFLNTFETGISSLLARKLRSFLAMLGIIIGVGAVISMLALGSGARKRVIDGFTAMGSNLLMLSPGQHGRHGVWGGTFQNLTVDDADALVSGIPELEAVAPVVQGSAQVKYFNRNTNTSIIGTSSTYFRIRNLELKSGRLFSDGEAEYKSRVAVIGPTTAKNLFGASDPIGETVKINGLNFTVVGLTVAKGESWMSPDDRMIVPYTTAMRQLFGLRTLRQIDMQVRLDSDIDKAQSKITALMRRRHRILPEKPDDFTITNMTEIRERVSEMVNLFRGLLGSIAAISLLVGGIGIMNIMLVSVTERTREIGIRKAIGAKDRHILIQFLIESVTISGLGGILGVGAGIGAAKVIPKFIEQLPSVIEWPSVLLALLFSAAVGIFFGLYPAWRAAMLDPIEALRYE